MSLKAKIEAILYMTDKPLRAQAIAGIVGEDLQVVRQALLDLIHDYEERQGGLEIADEDGYSLQVRDQFANLMDQFMPIEMTAALLRTLSAIAIKQPIPQSEIIRIRGAGAYEHIKELVVRGLVSKREDEKTRSPLLSTTKQFQEYFRLTKDGKSLRQYLKREMKKKDKEDILVPEPLPGQAAVSADLSFAPEPEAAVLTVADPDLSEVSAGTVPALAEMASANAGFAVIENFQPGAELNIADGMLFAAPTEAAPPAQFSTAALGLNVLTDGAELLESGGAGVSLALGTSAESLS